MVESGHRMYSLLIADDEEIVRRGLAETMPWGSLGFKVVGTARDGSEALEKLDEMDVDVVLADIRMPRLTGLDLAARIRVRHPSTRVVILSGYDDFEYARKAIEHEVFSYLLKPLREDRAAEVFSRLRSALDTEQNETTDKIRGRTARLREALREVVDSDADGSRIQDILNNSYPGGIVMMLDPCPLGADSELRDKWHAFLPRFLEELDGVRGDLVATSLDSDRMALLIVAGTAQLDTAAEEVFREVRLRGREFGSMDFTAALGPPAVRPADIRASAEQAHHLLGHALYLGKNRLIRSGDVHREGCLDLPDTKAEAERFIDVMIARDESVLISRTDSIFTRMRDASPRDSRLLMSWFRGFFYSLEREIRDRGFDPGVVLGRVDRLLEILELTRTIGDMRDVFYKMALSSMEVTSRASDSSHHRLVRYSIEALRNRYSEDIGLESLAYEQGVSSPYLSRLFKSEMGVNFKEYLTRIRLDKARELLRKTDNRIYEVAASVGYPDQKYFCEIFKRRTGMTPREYRQDVRPPS